MKTDEELNRIAQDITEKAKLNMRAQSGTFGTLSDVLKITKFGDVWKDTLLYITDLINDQHLEPDEEVKVAKKVRWLLFFSARRERKHRKNKVIDDDS